MNPALQPFLTVALPIMVTLVASMWSNNSRLTDMRTDFNRAIGELRADVNRRFDDVNRRFDEVTARLDRIERKLDNHEERIVRVEERTSILHS
jgi:hypothetical protein